MFPEYPDLPEDKQIRTIFRIDSPHKKENRFQNILFCGMLDIPVNSATHSGNILPLFLTGKVH
jgi:hypothetical protein